MSEKRFTVKSIKNNHYQIAENDLKMLSNEVVDLLNSQSKLISAYQYEFLKMRKENEQLRTQLLICQQSKNDDGQFKVWQVPPIRVGMRVSTTTIDDEQKKDSKRWRWSE